MCAGLPSSPALAWWGCWLARQTELSIGEPALWWSADHPPMIPCRKRAGSNVQRAPGMPASLPAAACQASLSPGPPPFPPPPPPAHLCQPPASISAFKPALASALAPPQLNWTSSCLPAFPAPRGQRGCSRLSEAAEELLGSAAAKPALPAVGCRQAWAATRYLPPPRVAHFADHLRCRANSVLNPIVSLPSSPRSLA